MSSDGAAGTWNGGQATLFEFAFHVNATPAAALLVVFSAGGGPGGSGFEASWGHRTPLRVPCLTAGSPATACEDVPQGSTA